MDLSPIAQTGESSQTDVVEAGGGKMYLTKGQKRQTRCVHLSVDAKEQDPVRKLYKQMDDVLEQARRDGHELPEYKPKNAPKGTALHVAEHRRREAREPRQVLLAILDTLGLQMDINLKTLDYEAV